MSVTVYNDVILKNSVISSNITGRSNRKNTRVVTEGGDVTVNIQWQESLREYEISTIPLSIDNWELMEGLFEITEGGAYGFLMHDPKDFKVNSGEGKASLITGATYQMKRRYSTHTSNRYKDRDITRPRNGTITVTYNGGAAPSYTIDYDTGIITFTGGPVGSAALISWTGEFYVPVHFAGDVMGWDLVAPGAYEARYTEMPTITLMEVRE